MNDTLIIILVIVFTATLAGYFAGKRFIDGKK